LAKNAGNIGLKGLLDELQQRLAGIAKEFDGRVDAPMLKKADPDSDGTLDGCRAASAHRRRARLP
jgi:hypothetical protein